MRLPQRICRAKTEPQGSCDIADRRAHITDLMLQDCRIGRLNVHCQRQHAHTLHSHQVRGWKYVSCLLAEDLARLHDVLEGHKVLNAPVQPDLVAGGCGVWFRQMQCLSSRINALWHAGSRHLSQGTAFDTVHVYKASKGAVEAGSLYILHVWKLQNR